jgi:hypothetical protein
MLKIYCNSKIKINSIRLSSLKFLFNNKLKIYKNNICVKLIFSFFDLKTTYKIKFLFKIDLIRNHIFIINTVSYASRLDSSYNNSDDTSVRII